MECRDDNDEMVVAEEEDKEEQGFDQPALLQNGFALPETMAAPALETERIGLVEFVLIAGVECILAGVHAIVLLCLLLGKVSEALTWILDFGLMALQPHLD